MQRLKIDELHESLDSMHKEVNETLSESRKTSIARNNARTHVYQCNFIVGDYVVVARRRGAKTKMSANRVGPRRVTQILSDFTVEVEHLLTKVKDVVHISRVNPYADALIGTPVEMKDIAEYSDRIWHSVDKIKDVQETSEEFEVLVFWKGLSAVGDTWESLAIMFEDVPTKVRNYIKRCRQNATTRKEKTSIGL